MNTPIVSSDRKMLFDAVDKARQAKQALQNNGYDGVKMDCYNDIEERIFRTTFAEILSPDLLKRVQFTRLFTVNKEDK